MSKHSIAPPAPSSARMARKLFVLAVFPFVLAAFFAVTGCTDPSKANSVNGKVTMGTEAVSGTVNYTDAADGSKKFSGILAPDGGYEIFLAPGNYKITVEGFAGINTELKNPTKDKKDAGGAVSGMPGSSSKIGVSPPARYKDAATSGLTFEVKPGKQTNNIELTEKK